MSEEKTDADYGMEIAKEQKEELSMSGENALVKTMDVDLTKDICVVVSENDCSDWMLSDGAIVHEAYTAKSRLWHAVERAKNMSRYGRVQICKLVPLGTVEECERRCK